MRYVYFVEGAVFVFLAVVGSKIAGISGLIIASILCTTCISGLYGIYHTARYCGFPLREVAVTWQRPPAKVAFVLVPLAVGVWWLSHALSPIIRFPMNALLVGVPGVYLVLRQGVPPSLRADIIRYVPGRVQPALRRWLAWG